MARANLITHERRNQVDFARAAGVRVEETPARPGQGDGAHGGRRGDPYAYGGRVLRESREGGAEAEGRLGQLARVEHALDGDFFTVGANGLLVDHAPVGVGARVGLGTRSNVA